MDLEDARRLERMQAHQPEATCTTLRDTGFGDLADDWVACQAVVDAEHKKTETEGSTKLVQAFAKMQLCWFKIQQLRTSAQRWLENLHS